jgi:hypothetical protein
MQCGPSQFKELLDAQCHSIALWALLHGFNEALAQPRWYSVLWSQQIASASVIHEITQSPSYLNHSEYNFNPDSSCPGRGSGSFKMRILEHLEDPCQRKMSRLRNWVSDRLRATVVWFGLGLDEAWAIIAGEPPGGKLGLSVNLLDSRRFFLWEEGCDAIAKMILYNTSRYSMFCLLILLGCFLILWPITTNKMPSVGSSPTTRARICMNLLLVYIVLCVCVCESIRFVKMARGNVWLQSFGWLHRAFAQLRQVERKAKRSEPCAASKKSSHGGMEGMFSSWRGDL